MVQVDENPAYETASNAMQGFKMQNHFNTKASQYENVQLKTDNCSNAEDVYEKVE